MQEELHQFKRNEVWHLEPGPKDRSIISTKWVFKNKLDEFGIVTWNKARLVVQGYKYLTYCKDRGYLCFGGLCSSHGDQAVSNGRQKCIPQWIP